MGILFRSGRIITGTGKVIRRGSISIGGPLLEFIGPEVRIRPRREDRVFNLTGMTVLPGFIDCHVHLCMDGSPNTMKTLAREPLALTALKAAYHARLTLEAGITTVRDMGGKDYVEISLRDGIGAGYIQGPRILCSGKMICTRKGYGWPLGLEVTGTREMRKAVKAQIGAGADVIKMIATGGILSQGENPGGPELTVEELRAGVREAGASGKRTATHAQGKEGILRSLEAGVTSIEHGIGLDEEAVDAMLKANAWLVPTLSPPYPLLKEGRNMGIPSPVIDRAERAIHLHRDSLEKAHAAGIPIAMGTDAGTPLNFHGSNLKELELLVRSGFSPMEAIVSATRTASKVLGLEKEIGTLEKGKQADLIVVDGDPLEDIRILQDKGRIPAVLKGGIFFKCLL